MTKEKIKIKEISIKLLDKEFSYYPDEKEQEKKSKKELQEFREKNAIAYEEELLIYKKGVKVYYYHGYVEFLPVKKDGSSIKMDIKLPKDAINSVVAMCLDSVCSICEKQTKAFQNSFVNFVQENSDSLTNQTEKLKESLIARGVNKILNIGDKKHD